MVNNKQSLSEQSQRRGNLILLIIGIVLGLLFIVALCQMPNKTTTLPQPDPQIEINTGINRGNRGKNNGAEPVNWNPGDGRLFVNPTSVSLDSVVGKSGETEITLKAENAPIKLYSKALSETQEKGFELFPQESTERHIRFTVKQIARGEKEQPHVE